MGCSLKTRRVSFFSWVLAAAETQCLHPLNHWGMQTYSILSSSVSWTTWITRNTPSSLIAFSGVGAVYGKGRRKVRSPFQNNDLVSQWSQLGLTSASPFSPTKNRVLIELWVESELECHLINH